MSGGLRGEQAVAAMMFQMQIQQDLFTRLKNSCFEKCCPKFREAEMTVGETACTDRCVTKFMQVYELVGARMLAQNNSGSSPPP